MPARRPLLAIIPLALLVGCESMDAPGKPFDPVAVQAQGATAAAPAPAFAPVPGWEDVEPFTMASEDFVTSAPPAAVAPPAGAPAADSTAEPEPAEPVPDVTVVPAAPAAVAAPPLQGMGVAAGWPVRLVKAIPDSVPPRAIVGLPDGTELVVTPGAMLAAQGLIVMAIGKDQMQLAQVSANGDHATVVPMTLLALY
jgi:hypothetical protein